MIILNQRLFSSLTKIGGGGSVLVGFGATKPKRRFRQPWKTSVFWNPEFDRWEARINPGFVNGWDPLVNGYLRDEDGTMSREVDLIRDPNIPIFGYRRIPDDGDPVPDFFKELGVREKSKIEIDENGSISIDETPNELPQRFLIAVDFYLAVARATYRGVVTEVDAIGATGLVVDYSVTFDTTNLDRVGARPRLMQAAKYPAVRPPTFFERLAGTFQDEGEDRQWISTVYLLSPENVEEGPDALWTPYVDHESFWNFEHDSQNAPPAKPIPPIRIFTGLGLGLGDIIANQGLSGINEFAQLVNNAVNTTSNVGMFYSVP